MSTESPTTLGGAIDRYNLGDAVRRAFNKHGNSSWWCSIADDVIAELHLTSVGADAAAGLNALRESFFQIRCAAPVCNSDCGDAPCTWRIAANGMKLIDSLKTSAVSPASAAEIVAAMARENDESAAAWGGDDEAGRQAGAVADALREAERRIRAANHE